MLVERGRQRRGRDDAPEGAAVGAQGDGGERRPKRARRAPFPARRVERFHTLRVLLCARCKRAPPRCTGETTSTSSGARAGRARVCVCVCGGGGQCARVARSTDNDGAQQYSAHASNHVTVRTNSYSGARAHNNTCQKTTSAGASRRTAGCSKTHHLSPVRAPGSRLQARGNVHAQFRSALLDELDFGTRARGARAGMCKNEAPGLGPPTACSRTARPLRAPPAPPCAPAAARTSISMII